MEIREAVDRDLPKIIDIIDDARKLMRESGNMTQWINGYPSANDILEDISAGNAYICLESDLAVGYFCFQSGENPDKNYDIIVEGNWLNDNPYGVIHRLASSGKSKGIAKAAFDFAFSKISNIRIDTHRDNHPMQNLMKTLGFTYCGIIYVADGSERDAFQKIID